MYVALAVDWTSSRFNIARRRRREKNFFLLRSLMEEDDRINISNHSLFKKHDPCHSCIIAHSSKL